MELSQQYYTKLIKNVKAKRVSLPKHTPVGLAKLFHAGCVGQGDAAGNILVSRCIICWYIYMAHTNIFVRK